MGLFTKKPLGTIRRRVMAKIEERIAVAEEDFQESQHRFEVQYQAEVQSAYDAKVAKTESRADELVAGIVG